MKLRIGKNSARQAAASQSHDTFGHIDSYSCGQLRGWVKRKSSNDPVRFVVRSGDTVVGEGVAGQYREDLEKADIGKGNHGFEIALKSGLAITKGMTVQLFDSQDNSKVASNDFELSVIENIDTLSTEITDKKFQVLLRSDSFKIQPALNGRFLIDGEEVSRWGSDNKPAAEQFLVTVQIPEEAYDLCLHIFSLEVDACDEVCGETLRVLQPLSTPWKYLKSSATRGIYGALDSIAAYRYESLKLQIANTDASCDAQTMQNIATAHDVVIEGYQNRKKFPTLVLPAAEKPQVSILVPAYNKFELTYNCIASIILAYNRTSYEVILIDDCSTDETAEAEKYIENLKVVRNEQNLRFLLSCNNGSQQAAGEYIMFLNNDTEVTSGWLDNLISVFDRFDHVGLVGSKLIYPDGKLQEAGGIVWGNGQPWNIGNRANAFAPEYNYVRQADYVSGAAMMITRELWESLGRFSEEFAPSYFEDTDLAFKVRESGHKVIYSPKSVVVHFEGMSNGTDLTKGVKKYQNVNFPKFKEKWVQAYKGNGVVGKNLHLEKDRGIEYRALVIDYTTPDTSRDAGSYAAVQEMKLLQSLGFKVTFLPDNQAHMGRATEYLQDSGIECLYHPFVDSISDYIGNHGKEYDIVYITRYDIAEKYLQSIRKSTDAKIIFNNADLHFLREIRAIVSAKGKDFSSALATREKELEVMRNVDVTLSYNEAEHAVISSHNVDKSNVCKCPWVLYPKNVTKPFSERNGLAFLGGYNHAPNVESVKYLAANVMPKLLERDESIKLYVYGSAMTAEIEALAAENIEIVGFAESLDDVYTNCRIFVAPLLSGAGIKGKVLESMSYNVPSVLSPIAAEGTGLSNGVSCLIAENDEEWVEQIIKLYNDEQLWNRMAENSGLLTRSNYSFGAARKAFRKMLNSVDIFTMPESKALYNKKEN
ncbi:MAG: glycosyltransferase [Gammaproteobacteria bacterium]|nr:glycosyltransferase [Gammaproteobacteria bacterium]